jgi:hypothetical protein
MVFFLVLHQTKQQTNPNFLGLALQAHLLNGFSFVLHQTKQQTNPNFLGLALPCSSIYNPNAIVFLECMVMCYGMGPIGTIPPRNAQCTW